MGFLVLQDSQVCLPPLPLLAGVTRWKRALTPDNWWPIWAKEAQPFGPYLQGRIFTPPPSLIVSLQECHLYPITAYKTKEYIMQIIRLETNTSVAVPQRRELPSLMSRVEREYSYLFFNSAVPSPATPLSSIYICSSELSPLSFAPARRPPGTRR